MVDCLYYFLAGGLFFKRDGGYLLGWGVKGSRSLCDRCFFLRPLSMWSPSLPFLEWALRPIYRGLSVV